jgi:hypothetical protein
MNDLFAAPDKNKPTGSWCVPDEGMYDAYIFDAELVPNPWYEVGEPEHKKWQIKWTINEFEDSLGDLPEGSDPDTKWSNRVTYFTGTKLGWHKKNKITGFLRVADPKFVYDEDANDGAGEMTSYADLNAIKAAVEGQPVRIIISHNVKKQEDGSTRTYQQIDKVLKSNHAKLPFAELLALKTGGDVSVMDKDIEF